MTKGIILAAGRGSRMGAMTDNAPKCMTMLHGKPLLEWQLAALRRAGVGEVALITGYCSEKLQRPDVELFHNHRWAECNMVRTLTYADQWLAENNCIISYSDIFYGAAAVEKLIDGPGDIGITYDRQWLKLWGC